MISKVCLEISPARANAIQAIFDELCLKYNIASPNDKAAFLAQIAHESGEFTIKSENMNYTHAERIVDIWPTRFNLSGTDKLNANDYTFNPQKLANEVYANRMGNGDQESGDGYRFRGAGFLQLTGRQDYTKYAAYINKPLPDTAALIKSDDLWAMDAAAWEYVVSKKLLGEADFVEITKKVNGGVIGLGERKKYYERALNANT